MTTSTGERPQPAKTIVLDELWRRYKRSNDRALRDQLIMAYAPLVKYVAGRVVSRMPAHVDLADLVSYGFGGLIEAVERFEPARGHRFDSYAYTRIRGAIFDELRSLDWVPRSVRDEARHIDQAIAALTTRLQRTPTDAELAEELSMDAAELDAALQRVADAEIVALDQPRPFIGADGDQATLMDTLTDQDAVDPAAQADAAEQRRQIAWAIGKLPAREQAVLTLRYESDLKYSEIGEVIGVSESRVCQLHAKAVLQLETLLSDGGRRAATG